MGRGLLAKYLLPCCCIHDSHLFDMQHDHVLKILNFDYQGQGGGCKEKNCYHVAAFVISFNLMYNMTMHKLNFDLLTPPHEQRWW